ncbi:MAG: mechanosensitive ion channel family protein [Pseudomonadota bacterium]|nr:mechanosensitive ion channel family protein [Pseudomonadota bacterium]
MDLPPALHDALLFTVAGAFFALVMMRWKRDQRQGMLQMLILLVIGVSGLLALNQFGTGIADTAAGVGLRELGLLLAAFGFIRIFLVFVFQGIFARMALPRILGDVLFAFSLVTYAVYRMYAVGFDFSTIAITSTILGGGVAFSLKEPLTNLWGGVAIQLDNTCRIGDWIRIEGAMGQVVSIRWRYTALATNAGETLIIPNSALVGQRVNLLARRGDQRIPWRRPIEFAMGYEWPPSRVIAVVDDALARADIANVARAPAPSCVCWSFDATAIRYNIRYWLTDLSLDELTDSEIRVHAFAALAREGMEIPIPRHELFMNPASEVRQTAEARERDARVLLLESLELFAPLTDEERLALASELKPSPFVVGDIATRQGEPADSLYILARGHVGIFHESADGATNARQRLATLHAPAYFGEMGLLTGQPRGATVAAESEVLCYRLGKPGFEAILRSRPELAQALSQTLAARQAANDATLATLSAEARTRATGTRANDLVRRIQEFFGL